MRQRLVSFHKSDAIGTITLNRPEKLNAINFPMLDEMAELLREIVADEEVRVVVLTGSGRYFSAGADLEIVGTMTPQTFRLNQRRYWNAVFNSVEDLQKLTIAAWTGPPLGGGLELALCCDLRYAVEGATFSLPEINFGIIPDSGGTIRLPQLTGLARAKEVILSGDSIDARRAEAIGLLNGVFPQEEFEDGVRKIALKMAEKAPLAVGMGKQLINRSFQHGAIRLGLEQAAEVQSMLITTEDYREAVRAFQEKRPPVFRGK